MLIFTKDFHFTSLVWAVTFSSYFFCSWEEWLAPNGSWKPGGRAILLKYGQYRSLLLFYVSPVFAQRQCVFLLPSCDGRWSRWAVLSLSFPLDMGEELLCHVNFKSRSLEGRGGPLFFSLALLVANSCKHILTLILLLRFIFSGLISQWKEGVIK